MLARATPMRTLMARRPTAMSTLRRAGAMQRSRALCASSADDDEEDVHQIPRYCKIVATIGPASEEAEPLKGCVAAGMNVMRINFSHATVDEFHLRQRNLRAAPGGRYNASA